MFSSRCCKKADVVRHGVCKILEALLPKEALLLSRCAVLLVCSLLILYSVCRGRLNYARAGIFARACFGPASPIHQGFVCIQRTSTIAHARSFWTKYANYDQLRPITHEARKPITLARAASNHRPLVLSLGSLITLSCCEFADCLGHSVSRTPWPWRCPRQSR